MPVRFFMILINLSLFCSDLGTAAKFISLKPQPNQVISLLSYLGVIFFFLNPLHPFIVIINQILLYLLTWQLLPRCCASEHVIPHLECLSCPSMPGSIQHFPSYQIPEWLASFLNHSGRSKFLPCLNYFNNWKLYPEGLHVMIQVTSSKLMCSKYSFISYLLEVENLKKKYRSIVDTRS